MAENIKGLTVVIDGETRGLDAALKGIDKRTNSINKELGQIERGLKFDPKNTVLLGQKQQLLAEKIENTRERLDALRAAQHQVDAMYKAGEIDDGKYRAFQRDIVATENKLETFTQQLKQTDRAQDAIGDGAKKLGGKLKGLFGGFVITGGDVVNALKSAASALWGFIEAYAEGEKYVARLQQTVEASGEGWLKNRDLIEDNVDSMMMLGAYADDELNAALARLVQSTGDVDASIRLLGLAMDVARGTGKGLEETALMIAKVYGGNVGALKKFGITLAGVSDSTEALAELQRRYEGQAERYGETTAGALDKTQIVLDELKESFAKGIVEGSLGGLATTTEGLLELKQAVEDLSDSLFRFYGIEAAQKLMGVEVGAKEAAQNIKGLTRATEDLTTESDESAAAFDEQARAMDGTKVAADSLAGMERTLAELENDKQQALLAAKDAQEDLNEAMAGGDQDEIAKATLRLEDANWRAADATADLVAKEQELGTTTSEVAQKKELEAWVASIRDRAREAAAALDRMGDRASAAAVKRGAEWNIYFASRQATGSILPATPGGVPVIAAEAGYDEAFIPINSSRRSYELLAETMRRMGVAGGGGATNTMVNHFHAPVRTYAEVIHAEKDLLRRLYQ